ncbi:MAG: hypothetical protein AAGC47_05115 [Bacteroidota bacterium]
MSKFQNIWYALMALTVLTACNKEDGSPSDSFFKSIETDFDYLSKSIVESNGDLVLGCISAENEELVTGYGEIYSKLYRFTGSGDELWSIDLPGEVYELWQVLALSNGKTLVMGFDSTRYSETLGLAVVSESGEVLHRYTREIDMCPAFANCTGPYVSGKLLSDGTIALVTYKVSQSDGSTGNTILFILLDENLNELNFIGIDELEQPDGSSGRFSSDFSPFNIDADDSFKINTNWRRFDSENNLTSFQGFLSVSLSSSSVELAIERENDLVGTSHSSVLAASGKSYWVNVSNSFAEFSVPSLNLRNQEEYSIGQTINVWSGSEQGIVLEREFEPFSRDGAIVKILGTADGGFLIGAISNIDGDSPSTSEFSPQLIKLRSDLSIEWSQQYQTGIKTLLNDIIETQDGFVMAVTYLNTANASNAGILKVNKQGFLN